MKLQDIQRVLLQSCGHFGSICVDKKANTGDEGRQGRENFLGPRSIQSPRAFTIEYQPDGIRTDGRRRARVRTFVIPHILIRTISAF